MVKFFKSIYMVIIKYCAIYYNFCNGKKILINLYGIFLLMWYIMELHKCKKKKISL